MIKYKTYYVRPDSIHIKDNKLINLIYKNKEVKSLVNYQKEVAECNSLYEAICFQTRILNEIFPNNFIIPEDHYENGKKFADKLENFVNELAKHNLFPKNEIRISSGYRHLLYCSYIGGAMKGQHTTFEAVDIEDIDNTIDNWLYQDYEKNKNQSLISKFDITLEHKNKTNSWTHWQNRLPASGNRIFMP